jgi:hypothetical protein
VQEKQSRNIYLMRGFSAPLKDSVKHILVWCPRLPSPWPILFETLLWYSTIQKQISWLQSLSPGLTDIYLGWWKSKVVIFPQQRYIIGMRLILYPRFMFLSLSLFSMWYWRPILSSSESIVEISRVSDLNKFWSRYDKQVFVKLLWCRCIENKT